MTDPLAIAAAKIEITDKQRQAFLDIVHADPTAGTAKALRQAGVKGSRGQLRRLVKDDDELAQDARDARGYGDNTIRAEIKRRAIEGVVEPVFGSLGGDSGSGIVGEKRVYSDRLLGMMAKAYLPEYREKIEHTVEGSVEVANSDVAAAIDRFTGTVRRLAERAQSSGAVRALDAPAADEPAAEAGS